VKLGAVLTCGRTTGLISQFYGYEAV
jgi:hypothetical protein